MGHTQNALAEFIKLAVMTGIDCIFVHLVFHINLPHTNFNQPTFLFLVSSLYFISNSYFL